MCRNRRFRAILPEKRGKKLWAKCPCAFSPLSLNPDNIVSLSFFSVKLYASCPDMPKKHDRIPSNLHRFPGDFVCRRSAQIFRLFFCQVHKEHDIVFHYVKAPEIMKTGLFPGFFPHGKYTKNGGKIFVEKHGKKPETRRPRFQKSKKQIFMSTGLEMPLTLPLSLYCQISKL